MTNTQNRVNNQNRFKNAAAAIKENGAYQQKFRFKTAYKPPRSILPMIVHDREKRLADKAAKTKAADLEYELDLKAIQCENAAGTHQQKQQQRQKPTQKFQRQQLQTQSNELKPYQNYQNNYERSANKSYAKAHQPQQQQQQLKHNNGRYSAPTGNNINSRNNSISSGSSNRNSPITCTTLKRYKPKQQIITNADSPNHYPKSCDDSSKTDEGDNKGNKKSMKFSKTAAASTSIAQAKNNVFQVNDIGGGFGGLNICRSFNQPTGTTGTPQELAQSLTRFAMSKMFESPAAAKLPKPPKHWTSTAIANDQESTEKLTDKRKSDTLTPLQYFEQKKYATRNATCSLSLECASSENTESVKPLLAKRNLFTGFKSPIFKQVWST